MREKILARLRALYPGVNLSNQRTDAIADRLATKITNEDEIDNKLNELNDVMPFADIAKQDDRLRTLESKTKKDDSQQSQSNQSSLQDEVPAWAKAMMNELQSLKHEKAITGISQKLSTHEKLKTVPASFWNKRALPQKEEDVEAFVDEIEKDYTSFKQDVTNQQLFNQTPPYGGNGGANTDSIDKAIEAWAGKGTEAKK